MATAHFWPAPGLNPRQAGTDDDGTPLFLAIGTIGGGVHPGKIRADWQKASISFGGAEEWVADPKVWVGNLSDGSPGSWCVPDQVADTSWVPVGNEADGTVLYAARAWHNGGHHVGKWRADWTVASIPYSGAELWLGGFEILCTGVDFDEG
jgi:hypothetical protein